MASMPATVQIFPSGARLQRLRPPSKKVWRPPPPLSPTIRVFVPTPSRSAQATLSMPALP